MKTVTVSQMKELDRRTIEEAGITGEILMERAGAGAGRLILEFISTMPPKHVKRFVLLAGKGNNGGDAYVAARFLHEHTNKDVQVYAVCPLDELSGDAGTHAKKLPDGVYRKVCDRLKPEDFFEGDIIIDGLLGTGIGGPLRPPYDQWISVINSLCLPVVALDIPSGLNGDDGKVEPDAILADLTITMGLPKRGMVLNRGPEFCGRLRCVDIGIPSKFVKEVKSNIEMTFAGDVSRFLSRVPIDTYKGKCGRLLVIGGSYKYRGAPFLSAVAALRTGAGLVTVAVPQSMGDLPPAMLSLIVRRIPDNGLGTFSRDSLPELNELLKCTDAAVIGPGLTDELAVAEILRSVITVEKPMLFDADALNMLSSFPELVMNRLSHTILTPHHGEMQRLLKGCELEMLLDSDRLTKAQALAAKTESTVILKGNRTIIASIDRVVAVNSSGSPALATAGSGDVLAGITGALLARGIDAFDASVTAAYIHGLAGEPGKFGVRGLTADDLVDMIPEAMKEISPFA